VVRLVIAGRWTAGEQLGGQDRELLAEAGRIRLVAGHDHLGELRRLPFQLGELLEQAVVVQGVRELAELRQARVRHQLDVLAGVAERDDRLAELERADHVVVPRGDDHADGRHRPAELGKGKDRLGDDPRRVEVGPVRPDVSQDFRRDLVVRPVADEEPDRAVMIDQPADEALHGRDVRRMDAVGLTAMVVGAVIRHHADTDGPAVGEVVGRRRGREHEIRVDKIAGDVEAALAHGVPRLDVAVGAVEGKPGGHVEQRPRDPLVDDRRTDADQGDLRAREPPGHAEQEHRIGDP
jgi:hypothetical protein